MAGKTDRTLILHPLLLAAYPALSLIAANIQQIPLSQALRPLGFSLIGALLLLGILRLIVRDWLRAGILVSLFLLTFFSYGQVYDLIKDASVAGLLVGRHRFLSLVWLLVLGGVGWLILRIKADRARSINAFLNLASVIAVALPLLSMARLGVLSSRAAFDAPPSDEGGGCVGMDRASRRTSTTSSLTRMPAKMLCATCMGLTTMISVKRFANAGSTWRT
jgi:hypothetical protein